MGEITLRDALSVLSRSSPFAVSTVSERARDVFDSLKEYPRRCSSGSRLGLTSNDDKGIDRRSAPVDFSARRVIPSAETLEKKVVALPAKSQIDDKSFPRTVDGHAQQPLHQRNMHTSQIHRAYDKLGIALSILPLVKCRK